MALFVRWLRVDPALARAISNDSRLGSDSCRDRVGTWLPIPRLRGRVLRGIYLFVPLGIFRLQQPLLLDLPFRLLVDHSTGQSDVGSRRLAANEALRHVATVCQQGDTFLAGLPDPISIVRRLFFWRDRQDKL